MSLWSIATPIGVYLAFTGWGGILAGIARPSARPDLGLLAAWGMGLSCVAGGVLNLFGLISPTLLQTYLFLGAAAFVVWAWQGRRRIRTCAARLWERSRRNLLFVCGILLLAAMLAATFTGAESFRFNPHDDMHAYLVFPSKMIEAGSLGADPFCERRMLEYGGQSFLHALMMTLLGLNRIHVTDLGVGWLVVLGLVVGHCRRVFIPAGVSLLLLIGLQSYEPPVVNVTSVVTGAALFYGLLRTFVLVGGEPYRVRCVLLGVMAAGIVSLKNSYVLPCALMLLALLTLASERGFRMRVLELVGVGAVTALLVLPWGVSMYRSNGTFLYPLLGEGFCGTRYGPFVPVSFGGKITPGRILSGMGEIALSSAFITGAVLTLLSLGRSAARRVGVCAFAAAWTAALPLLLVSTTWRYLFPFTFAVTIFVLVEALGLALNVAKCGGIRGKGALVILCALMLFWCRETLDREARFDPDVPKGGWDLIAQVQMRELLKPEELEMGKTELRALQAKIPAGVAILARLSRPFNLDLKRNTVYVIDWPGASSPPPGLPCFGRAENLARYLRALSIRYVMYSYGDEAGFPKSLYSGRLLPGDNYLARLRCQAEYTFAFQDRLMELSRSYRKVGDDGKVFLLDLGVK